MGVDYTAVAGIGVYTTKQKLMKAFNLEEEDDVDFMEVIDGYVEYSEYKEMIEVKEYGSRYAKDNIDYMLLFKSDSPIMSEEYIKDFREFEQFLKDFKFDNNIEFITEMLIW
jgi:hypothetical protein